jgi:Threonine dehydrogenase and related Zn-dependent dehydrogenases
MRTKAVRIYGRNDLRLEEFSLPAIGDDEILAKVVSDSLCMSTHKAALQGADHKRIPGDVAANPAIIGHEFCGQIIEVGGRWQDKFAPGDNFSIQPAFNYRGSQNVPGYAYPFIGGDATYVVIPAEAMIMDCVLKYDSDVYFYGSLAEPMSCIVGAFHAFYHTRPGEYVHDMGIKEGGNMAILAGVGPMGLGSIDYALHCDRRPGLLVVTDIDGARLARAAGIHTAEEAAKQGVALRYVGTREPGKIEEIRAMTGGAGFDDVLVMAPVKPVVEQGDALLGRDGCLSFFAGPTDQRFSAGLNFYNVHYNSTHIVGTSGGNSGDMRESLGMMAAGRLTPAAMITHVGGLDSVIGATLRLDEIPGGKKLIYTHISMPLTAIEDFDRQDSPLFRGLAEITKKNGGFWSAGAEKFLLDNGTPIG